MINLFIRQRDDYEGNTNDPLDAVSMTTPCKTSLTAFVIYIRRDRLFLSDDVQSIFHEIAFVFASDIHFKGLNNIFLTPIINEGIANENYSYIEISQAYFFHYRPNLVAICPFLTVLNARGSATPRKVRIVGARYLILPR